MFTTIETGPLDQRRAKEARCTKTKERGKDRETEIPRGGDVPLVFFFFCPPTALVSHEANALPPSGGETRHLPWSRAAVACTRWQSVK